MFDGVPEQFHQFIASRTSLPLPLSFNLHGLNQTTFSTFDPYPSHQTVLQQPSFLQQLHHQSIPNKDEEREEDSMLSTNLELERERPISEETIDPWSNDEVLVLLRIRSSMENWFPDFTWEHVSSKLAELGFKRSAEKCKEKFEEETRQFNNIGYTKNYRLFNELELCHGQTSQINLAEKKQDLENPIEEEDNMGQILEEDSRFEKVELNPSQENEKLVGTLKSKKRKRKEKFGMLKSFCEEVVKKMIAQQEEWHNKLLEDMVRREKEKIEREEAWKKQEMETIHKELEKRAHEQAIAGTRQATIIEFLKKFTSNEETIFVVPNSSSISLSFSPSQIETKNPNSTSHEVCNHENLETATSSLNQNNTNVLTSFNETQELPQNPNFQKVPTSSTLTLDSQNPNSKNTNNDPMETTPSSTQNPPENPNFGLNEREDVGKRWPRDEVLALINLRSSLYSNGEDKEGASKGPLWERISEGMFGLGYKRSAKRCKEKWENINKYFRKTKDANKKRSLESRTCPYFHQLSSLYNQGTIVALAPADGPGNHSGLPESHSALPDNHLGSSHGGSNDVNFHASDGDKSVTQVPGFNFEF